MRWSVTAPPQDAANSSSWQWWYMPSSSCSGVITARSPHPPSPGDSAAIIGHIPAAASAACSAAALTQLTLFYPKWRSMHLSFPCSKKNQKKKTHKDHLLCRLRFLAYKIGYFRCHPSQSPLTGMRHLHPGWWVKRKVGSSGFHIWFHFSQLPPFSPSLGVGRTAVPAPSYLRRASRAAIPPLQTGQSHCSNLRGADGK